MTTRFARAPARGPAARRVRQGREPSRTRPRSELLADAAAAAVLGGRTDVGREVGQAPAATADVAGSPGAPLASPLRQRLERGFGADLGAVRVHTDAAAAHAARAERARAFAAGADVYLDLPAHALGSEAGLRLLAHEVAHVLQQTGRRNGHGRLRATNLGGSGVLQCDLAAEAEEKGLFATSPPSWADLVKAHGGAKGLGAHLTTLELIIGGVTPAGAQTANDLASLASDPKVKVLPPAIRAFYVDAMKWAGAFDAARALLLRDVKLVTAFRSRPFYEHVRGKGLDWLGPLAKDDPFLRKYFPRRFVDVYRHAFYGSGRPLQDLDPQSDPGGPFQQRVRERIEALAAAVGRSENELAVLTLLAARALDSAREQWHGRQLAQLRSDMPKSMLPQIHRELAQIYKDRPVTDPILVPSVYEEAVPLYAMAAERIKTTATEAVAYWDAIFDALKSASTGKVVGAFHAADARARLEAVGTHRLFTKLGAALAGAGARVLQKKGKQLPDSRRFTANVEAARKALLSHSTIYTAALADLGREGTPTSRDAILIGLVLWRIANLLKVLDGHASRVIATGDDRTRRDARVATQILFAQELADIGRQMKIEAAVKAADSFLGEGYHLALLSDWEAVPNFGLREFRARIEHHEDEEELYIHDPPAGMTWATLRDFITAREFETIADTLSAVQPVAGTRALAGARKAAEAAFRPRSFVVKQHEWADPRQSSKPPAAAPAGNPFSRELNDNPLTSALKKKERQWDDIVIESLRYPGAAPISISFLPGMDRLMKVVHDRVGPQVEAAWQAKHPGAPALRPEDWNGYLEALRVYMESLTVLGKVTHIAQVRAAMSSHLATQRDRAYRAARKLASHDRRIAAAALRSLWQRFDRWDPATHELGRKALGTIEQFGRSVWPDEDRLMQVTTLVLETSEEMDATLRKKPTMARGQQGDAVVLGAIWPLVTGALGLWDSKTPTWTGNTPAADIVEMSGLSKAEVDVRVDNLRPFHAAIAERAEAIQRARGIVADAAAQEIHYVGRRRAVKKGEAFEGRYDFYMVLDVKRSFVYHPPIPEFSRLGLAWPGTIPGEDLALDPDGKPIASGEELLVVMKVGKRGGAETLVLKASDLPPLRLLTTELDWWTGFEHILGTFRVIEAVFNVILEVAELIPGVGQGLMVARFATGVLDTLTKPEFLQVLDLVGSDGLAAITGILDELMEHLEPAELLEVVLFEADFTPRLLGNKKIKNEDKANQFMPMAGQTRTSLWQRVARMLKNVALIGLRILDAFKRLAKKAQVPVRSTQMWALSHPPAAVLFDLLSRGLDLVSSMSLDQIIELLAGGKKGGKDLLASSLNQAAQDVVDRVRTIIDTLGRVELPREVVPVELIVDFFVEMVVNNIGSRKAKAVMKGGKAALEAVGLWGRVNSFISERIRVNNLDPNQFYRTEVVARLQPKLEGIRAGFMDELLGTLRDIPVLGTLAEPPGTPIRLDTAFTPTEFPESNPSAASPPSVRKDVALPAPAGGAPLAPSIRHSMERAWGHDLSHVRVHTGPDAARVTGAFGAEGITTGSHVYLGPGLSPSSDRGAAVLRHELAHVVQQTGPRPLGGAHGSTPSAGGAGRGLVWDAGREAEADHASHAAGPGPSAFGAAGAQPRFGKKFIKKFLNELGSARTLLARREEIESESKRAGPGRSPIAGKLKAAIDKLPASQFTPPFGTIQTQLLALTTALWPKVEAAFPILEQRSRVPVEPPEGSETATSQPYLKAELLQLEVRQFLYALTGIAYEVKLRPAALRIHGKDVATVDPADPVQSVAVVYFHAPFPEPGPAIEAIWDLLVEKSFTGTAGYSRTDATQHLTFKIATKMVVGKGIQLKTYEKAEFKLTEDRRDVIVNQVGRIEQIAKALADHQWPSPADYVKPEVTGFGEDNPGRNIGLRVGRYEDWEPLTHPVVDREPHHITQFLLVEYFYNRKEVEEGKQQRPKPFPFLGQTFLNKPIRYPGVSSRGDEVDAIEGAPGQKIDIKALVKPPRGGLMPIILVALPAHQSGLHYTPTKQKGGKGTSQRVTVDTTFKEALPEPVSRALGKPENVQALGEEPDERAKPKGLDVTPLEVKTAILSAARQTYRTMQDEMNPQLEHTLKHNEPRYYNLMAERMGSGNRLTWSAVSNTYQFALDRNREVIEQLGGFQ